MPLQTIYINGRFLTQPTTGVHRFALELVRALDSLLADKAIEAGHRFVLLSPRKTLYDLTLQSIGHCRVGFLSGHLWEQLELPLKIGTQPLINFYTAPVFKQNQLVTLHDASVFEVPETYAPLYAAVYRAVFRIQCRRSRTIVTVSEFSRDRISRYCGRPAEAIDVIGEGHEHISRCKADEAVFEKHGIDPSKPYILTVGMTDRKNLKGLVEAADLLNELPADLIITGGRDPNLRVSSPDLPPRVQPIGIVTDGELRALYEQAACLLFPSLYEGFGLPPLEAMACGCPVVLSALPVFKELFKEAAIFCNPRDAGDIAGTVKRVLQDASLRKQLKQKASGCMERYTWRNSARQMADIITRTFTRSFKMEHP